MAKQSLVYIEDGKDRKIEDIECGAPWKASLLKILSSEKKVRTKLPVCASSSTQWTA